METRTFLDNEIKRKWFVIYTRARWEKKVDQLLNQQGIESFCPLRTVTSQWSDRKKTVELPLFSSYVFVHVNLKEELVVRQTYGVLNFIYYMGKPAIIRDTELHKIKELLMAHPDAEVVSSHTVSVGDKVLLKQGVFSSHEGKVIKICGKTVLMLFDNLECAMVTRIAVSDLCLVPAR
ncbi:Transcriptional activator RfaH [Arcticibacter svalbardensis MN12-7]|uniref:Transcriptional activator RfaH n=1 Tax=Arcticibacter svalbardensis MN12-7 TaxID=1150600 RepID=R9GQK8_9SPHI|nr:UpxY family transcription antiterminator [Arcticibacter svalbardensis]EOR93825.1 Transcriptional activator RfaH [Arcticibacter svalbardensis MN12-7]